MDLSLKELSKLCLGNIDISQRCDETALDNRSNGRGGGGPMRQNRPFPRAFHGSVPYARDGSSSICDAHEEKRRRQIRFGRPNNGVRKIVVSNLNYKVTSDDIHRIFNKFGPLKSAALRFDGYGKSLGIADIVFGNKGAATRAMRRYNNAILDGRSMRIKLATNVSTRFRSATVPSLNGARGTCERGDRFVQYDGARGNNRGNRRGRNNGKKMICVDELDAQLDAYMRRNFN